MHYSLVLFFPQGETAEALKLWLSKGLVPIKATARPYVLVTLLKAWFPYTPSLLEQGMIRWAILHLEKNKTQNLRHVFPSSAWGSESIPPELVGDTRGCPCLPWEQLPKNVCQIIVYFFHGRAKESCNNIYHTEPWSVRSTANGTKITGFQEGATVGLGRGLKLRCVNYQKLDRAFFKHLKSSSLAWQIASHNNMVKSVSFLYANLLSKRYTISKGKYRLSIYMCANVKTHVANVFHFIACLWTSPAVSLCDSCEVVLLFHQWWNCWLMSNHI